MTPHRLSRNFNWRRMGHAAILAGVAVGHSQADPLATWNDGSTKAAIVQFVSKATSKGSAEFVKPAERIAVFDNDGTLWCEQPMYFQFSFVLDRVKAMAPEHPEWREKEPFRSVINGDTARALATGEKGAAEMLTVTHSDMTTEQFNAIVKAWITTARHPKYNRPYNQCVYQPMLELLQYLRANEFKTFIVSGGGVEFIRAFAEETYGIPPEQVVGSSGVVKFEMRDGKPVLLKETKVDFVDDGPGKPVGINRFIGRRPIMAFGNSDGDLQMLQYTTIGHPVSFAAIVHHDDADREVAYDRTSKIGKLDRALDDATTRGWTLISMKSDWKQLWPATAEAVKP